MFTEMVYLGLWKLSLELGLNSLRQSGRVSLIGRQRILHRRNDEIEYDVFTKRIFLSLCVLRGINPYVASL